MKKRHLFIPIIIIFFLIHLYLYYFVFDEIRPLISFILTSPFYIIVFVYYRETKLLETFSFISIFTNLSFWVFLSLSSMYNFFSPNLRLVGIVSFFGSVINMIIGFGIVLQSNRNRFVSLSIFLISIINFFFASYYKFFLEDLVAALFGPNPTGVNDALIVLEIFYVVLQFIIVIVQSIIIFIFDLNDEYDKNTFGYVKKY
ncbi:MAG: hypothetical protein PHF05_00685 [Candidatus Izemoplasmatales bacterium]|nr:hypothetical protein [Candidatus Izemoplasmatales bacterium]MDD4068950.1 hypothetical protein [Candidatus Izemoplasmatales bacterium]MDY0139198.1 hypothetical protein [Candidatus Izemoplasmatales bacterium]